MHPCHSPCQSILRDMARDTECRKGLHRGETVQTELRCSNNTALTLNGLKRCFFLTLPVYRPDCAGEGGQHSTNYNHIGAQEYGQPSATRSEEKHSTECVLTCISGMQGHAMLSCKGR